MDISLRYGCNPHQKFARLVQPSDRTPLRVLNGEASYINILDALTGWQLVRELAEVTGKAAAASFKHVSPAGAAVADPISEDFARAQFLSEPTNDPVTQAYVRARGADRMSSFGDACAVSHPVTVELATILKAEVSDLIIAPSYEPAALEVLRSKRRESYLILEIDPEYSPEGLDRRDVFGFALEQSRASVTFRPELFQARDGSATPESVVETMVVATTALKYTQSNSVCVAYEGQVIGMAAGQQSRIHATRIACDKAEKWMLQTHPKVLALRFPPNLLKPERANAVDQYVLWERLSWNERDSLSSALGYMPEPITGTERESGIPGLRIFVSVQTHSSHFVTTWTGRQLPGFATSHIPAGPFARRVSLRQPGSTGSLFSRPVFAASSIEWWRSPPKTACTRPRITVPLSWKKLPVITSYGG